MKRTISKQIIRWFCNETPEQKKHYDCYKGFTLMEGNITLKSILGIAFKMHGNKFSNCFFIDKELSIIMYCEGEIYVDIFRNKDEYNKQKIKNIEFYKNV